MGEEDVEVQAPSAEERPPEPAIPGSVTTSGSSSGEKSSSRWCGGKGPALTMAAVVLALILVVAVPTAIVVPRNSRNQVSEQQESSISSPSSSDPVDTTTTTTTTTVQTPAPTVGLIGPDSSTAEPASAPDADEGSSSSIPFTDPALPAGVVDSAVTSNGVEYDYCYSYGADGGGGSSSAASPLPDHHVVLLHGASFDRTVWGSDRTGILEMICEQGQVPLRVTAMDLSVSSDFQQLQETLEALEGGGNGGAGLALPVVLVTPSASGYSVVSLMMSGDEQLRQELPLYLEAWIPVAPVSLSSASDDEVITTLTIDDGTGGASFLPVLAIYGDEDTSGGRLSVRLGDLADARVVELSGGHPVYLRSPDEFVDEVLGFVVSVL